MARMQNHLQNIRQTTELCRYCLMCRHVCPVTAITGNEAASPHGWGLLIASVKRGVTHWHEETVDLLYQCADCGLCRSHCVTDQPLPLAINASRAEVVAQQKAPAAVYAAQKKLQQWGNAYVDSPPQPVKGQSDAALIVGAVGHYFQSQTVKAAIELLAAAGVSVTPIALGRENPHVANSLGLFDEAKKLAQDTLQEIKAVGAQRIFTLSPGDMYAFSRVLEFLGLTWPNDIELIDTSIFLAQQLEAGRISFKTTNLAHFAFYDPDQTVRVPGRWAAPRKLLAALSQTPPIELFWRKERAAPCGASGGLPFTQAQLSAQLAQARLNEACERGVKTLITDDPLAFYHLNQYANNGVNVSNLFQLLAAQLK
jgi:Fe-S oxidoreductase